MTDQNLEQMPPPVTIEKLRIHFREVYALTDPQIEIMLESSARSVCKALVEVQSLLQDEIPVAELKPFFHGMKGLLLNMGEAEWADHARELERLAEEGRLEYPKQAIATLVIGLGEVRDYNQE